MLFLLKHWKVLAGVTVIVSVLSAVYYSGYQSAATKYKADILVIGRDAALAHAKAVNLVLEKNKVQAELTEAQSLLYAELEKEAEVIYRENIKEIIKYRDNPNAGKCVLPDQFVRSYDAATAGRSVSEITETASGPQNSTVRVRDTEVLQNYVLNITQCRKWRRELVRWNEWYNNAEEQFNAE